MSLKSPPIACAQVLTIVFLALFPAVATAQQSELAITQLDTPPTIDGEIDPQEWSTAAILDVNLIQIEPARGEPSPLRTVIRIGQTPTAIYVAFTCHDPDPSRLAAAVTARDGDLSKDDSIGVMFDTFLDGRTAYVFQTNALATQWDGKVADNGRTVDKLWDESWRCAARRGPQGWSVEMEIPLSIMRLPAGSGRTWGLSVMRTVPRRLETALWPTPTENRYRVSNFGHLTGLELATSAERKWQAIPYALGVVDEDGNSNFEIGGDLRWRPSSSLGTDLTINPDFALIEADVEEINLTRFELFAPEKRPFFLEGSEIYSQRIRLFHSRRIGDITAGGKVIGTAGKTTFSALATSAEVQTDSTMTDDRADYAVLRVQQGLPRGSTVGLLGAARRLDGVNQGSAGLDATLFFTETLGLTAQLASVFGRTAGGGLAWFLRPAYDSNTTHFHVRYTSLERDIQDDFNSVGFMRDDDRREWDTNLSHTLWFDGSAVEKASARVNYNRFNSQAGQLRAWELDAEGELVFRNRMEVEVEYIDEYQRFEKGFNNTRTEISAGWDNRAGRSVFAFVGVGENFDSDLLLYGVDLQLAVGDELRASYRLTRLELDPDPGDDTTWIHVLQADYSFNPDNILKLFAQTNTAIDKVNVQAVWVWRIIPPFGSLQLAYQTGTSDLGEISEQGDTVFTKFAWVF